MKNNSSLPSIKVMKDASLCKHVMDSLKGEDFVVYCICSFMLSTGTDLTNTLMLTYDSFYLSYNGKLVPISNLFAGSRIVYSDCDCGLNTFLTDELSAYIMQTYSGVATDHVFCPPNVGRTANMTMYNRSSVSRKISCLLRKIGYDANASVFRNTFAYLYFCTYKTLVGTPFSYLCYREEQIKKVLSLSADEYRAIVSSSSHLNERFISAVGEDNG